MREVVRQPLPAAAAEMAQEINQQVAVLEAKLDGLTEFLVRSNGLPEHLEWGIDLDSKELIGINREPEKPALKLVP